MSALSALGRVQDCIILDDFCRLFFLVQLLDAGGFGPVAHSLPTLCRE